MFTFRSIELLHWDLWDHVRVPVDGQVVLFTGPNGCGKTTFLDAMRVLLNARRLSTSRRIATYLRGEVKVAVIKGVVTNELRKGTGQRPFTRRGVFDDVATLACVIERSPRGLERRYAILGGDVPVTDLQEVEGWMGPEAYSRALETAGVPRTMLKVLALEQGETHRLARRTPEQLLDYVLEMQGDREVLDRYARAVQHYRSAKAELDELEGSLVDHQRHVDNLEHDARSVQRLEALRSEAHEIRARRLPQARLRLARESIASAEAQLGERERALADVQSETAEASAQLERGRAEAARLEERRREQAKRQQELLREKDAADRSVREIRGRLGTVDRIRAEIEAVGDVMLPDDPEVALAALRDDEARELVALRALEDELGQMEVASRAEAPRPPLPGHVRRAVDALVSGGIEAAPVAHLLRIVEPRWRLAVESVLGRDRFTLVVPPADSLRSRQIARELRYPCYVSEAEKSARMPKHHESSALGVVHLESEGVPRWILERLARVRLVDDLEEGHELAREMTTITPDGYRQDRRGGIWVAAERLCCLHGPAGKGLDRGAAAADEERLRGQVRVANGRLLKTTRRRERIEAALRVEGLRSKLERAEGEAGELVEKGDALDERRRELSKMIYAIVGELEEIHEARVAVERERTRHEGRVGQVDVRSRALRGAVVETRAVLSRLRDEGARLEERLAADDRDDGRVELAGTPEALVARLRLIDEQIEGWTGPSDPRVLEIHDKALDELHQRKAHLARRREEHAAGEEELQRARRAYLRVLEETVRRYRAHIINLAERARIEAVVRAPRPQLDADGAAFSGGLDVRLGFDGKSPVPIAHPKLSGGQSVIASLILLMALTMQETKGLTGFFILDEPFAHLSAERVDEVARFLRLTRAQFILTSPTTHNLLTYKPADLVVSLRKKVAGSEFAPPPIFVRAA